ncbi:hypothetical protein PHET_10139 [Paragonimus heterotremus]|uniref:PARG helical domain-containing protein n=1 Tax=Paragonimus heterotremus TaxID=100268 RepID=A0A8J4WED5_9TREM|nr:hypothetical protein PHET_10139 [Paragonimus heterotremus]
MAHVMWPHQTPHWKAVKYTLTHVLEERLTIFQLICHLDHVENLVHFGQLTDRLLDDLPSRTTFFNLGGFLHGLPSNERHHFQNSILPFILRCVINLEHLCPESLLCRRKEKDCDTFVPFHLVTAMIACAFLCLLRAQWNSVILFDEFNFTNFFKRLTDTQFNHEQKLSSLIAYFDHCRQSTVTSGSAALRVIRRYLSVSLPLRLPETSFGDLPAQPLPDRIRHLLIYALKNVPLPCLFTDRCNRPTAIADEFHIPLVYFVNGYVSGNCLGSGTPQEASPFWLFPDLLACLPICHPLEEFEALWIDHYRGPFLPKQAVSDDTLKWRRLAVMNSGSLPCWASDRQFLESYLLDEIVKATVAFFGLGLSNLTQSVQPPPFCAQWWDVLFSREKSVAPTSYNRCDQVSEIFTCSATVVADRPARLTDYADRLAQVIIQQAYQRTRENWSASLGAQPKTTSTVLSPQSLSVALYGPVASVRANNVESAREYLPFSHLDSIKLSHTCCCGQSPIDSLDLPCPLSHTDIRVQPRQSLTGSTQSMPTPITWQSSTRSRCDT